MSKTSRTQQEWVAQEVPGATAEIRSPILSGKYQPGQILTYPDFRDVHSSYNVIAGALKELRELDLIETRPHIGTRVKQPGVEWTTTDDGLPHVVHIERIMRERLKKNELSPGEQLPTLVMLGEEFGVSFSLARYALRRLKKEGLIYTTPQGTWVSRKATPPPAPHPAGSAAG